MQQPAAFLERLFDTGVGIEHTLPREELDALEEMAAGSDRSVDLEPVLLAGREVVGAMSGRCVHRAGARVQRHVVGQHGD